VRVRLRYLLAFLTVRPRRWLFRRMACNYQLILFPRKEEYWGWTWPNLHWWALYWTVFKFFKWLNYDAWRYFCRWENGWRVTMPPIARIIQRVGQTTAGCVISGGECWHCASKEGCPVDLSQDETGKTFILDRTWTCATEDGTDHRFEGRTICPKCGYVAHYSEGSL
jgi:hypothetical protein